MSQREIDLEYEQKPEAAAGAKVQIVRTLVAGALMGAANLVPGVSGGTMVLACGVYKPFVASTAAATRLRFTRPVVLFIVLLWGAKLAAMGALAGPVTALVVGHRSLAYAAFAGMTLAGTPVLWRLLKKGTSPKWLLIALGVVGFAVLVLFGTPAEKPDVDLGEGYRPTINVPLDTVAGAAALSAMVLPGISGGTIKLILGRYEPTVWSIGETWAWLVPWQSASPVDWWGPIILPYVVGAIVGLVVVSNLLKLLLEKYEQPMAALLLGVLWGSAVAIWPRDATGPSDVAGVIIACIVGFVAVYALTFLKSGDEQDAPDRDNLKPHPDEATSSRNEPS